jgi:hypothetical protein
MRHSLPLVLFSIASVCAVQAAAEKLSEQERIELIRGLSSEYAKAKVELPRSKQALAVDTKGAYDRNTWAEAAHQYGPCARVGDMVQLTAVDIQSDRIVFAINGGFNAGKARWFNHVSVGMGGSTSPVSQPSNSNAPAGTSIVLMFNAPLPSLKPEEIKKMLSTVLDFEKRSATQTFFESLPPEMQQAVKDKRVVVGMNRDEVLAAVGKPVRKVRDLQDGDETEDWIYGTAPGKITFVTFKDAKVIKVREEYAGLGTEAPPLEPSR